MESWFCSYLCMVLILFTNISASPPRYTVHQTPVSFDNAMEDCSPGGILTTLATKQEVAEILKVVSKSVSPLNQNEFAFWVGLRKVRNECVVPTLPLRGFKWTEDGSEESQVSRWIMEPEHTCTAVRCGVLQVELNGTTVTRWGLMSVSCKNTYQFICKLTGGTTKPPKPAASKPEPAAPEITTPAASEPQPATPEPKPESKPEPPKPATPGPHQPESRPATQKPEPIEPVPPTQGPETNLMPENGSNLQEPDHDPGSKLDPCKLPDIPSYRSFIQDPNNSSRMQVECWFGDPVELHCSGHPTMWRVLDSSSTNLTTVCQPCDDGFKRDASGNCVDVDECSGGSAPCRYTCLNIEGSYRCVCTDEDGKHQPADSPACMGTPEGGDKGALSGILIPVLVAVAALVLLVVLVAVTVKCCLMRRSKKRAMKEAEKMAMKSKDANEKVAI